MSPAGHGDRTTVESGRGQLGSGRRLGVFAAILLVAFGIGSAIGAAWPDGDPAAPGDPSDPEVTVANHTDHSMSS